MMLGMEVRSGVLVLRLVAAAHVPAGEAEPEVHPGVADAEAVLTSLRARCDVADLEEVGTGRGSD